MNHYHSFIRSKFTLITSPVFQRGGPLTLWTLYMANHSQTVATKLEEHNVKQQTKVLLNESSWNSPLSSLFCWIMIYYGWMQQKGFAVMSSPVLFLRNAQVQLRDAEGISIYQKIGGMKGVQLFSLSAGREMLCNVKTQPPPPITMSWHFHSSGWIKQTNEIVWKMTKDVIHVQK